MLHLILCNIFKNFNSYSRETLWKSVHTGEEPYIYDLTIVRLVNEPASQNSPLSNLLVKINLFGHR